jgi:hypothetical protein
VFFDADRRATLRAYGVTLLYYGEIERRMGSLDPSRASYLEAVYDAGGVAICAARLG